jgi:hypothetical protein
MTRPPGRGLAAGLRELWQTHWVLVIGFCLAMAVTLFFAVRLVVHAVYWDRHQDMALEPWMTIGQIAQSYRIERDALAASSHLQRSSAISAGCWRRQRFPGCSPCVS